MSNWRPIDSAPRDGTPILAYMPPEPKRYGDGMTEAVIYVVYWHRERKVWREADGEDYAVYKPTHWMPLPEPPET